MFGCDKGWPHWQQQEVFEFGSVKLKLDTKESRPAIRITIGRDGDGWRWALEVICRSGGLTTGSYGLFAVSLPTRRDAIDAACSRLADFATDSPKQAPRGWEGWVESMFGDAGRQIELFGTYPC